MEDANGSAAKIQQVLTWIMEGNAEQMIRGAIAAKWPEDEDTPLIVAACEQVASSASQLRGSAADWCLESMRFLYAKQVELGEYAGAMRAVLEINKLASKYAAAQDESVTEKDAFPRIVNVADRRAELAERIARIG